MKTVQKSADVPGNFDEILSKMLTTFHRCRIPQLFKRSLSTSSTDLFLFSNVSLVSFKLSNVSTLLLQEASKSTGHSKLLAADHNEVFEVMIEDVSPRYWEEYLANKADYMKLLEAKTQNHCELIASWRFIYGDVNFRAMHLFKYSNVRN